MFKNIFLIVLSLLISQISYAEETVSSYLLNSSSNKEVCPEKLTIKSSWSKINRGALLDINGTQFQVDIRDGVMMNFGCSEGTCNTWASVTGNSVGQEVLQRFQMQDLRMFSNRKNSNEVNRVSSLSLRTGNEDPITECNYNSEQGQGLTEVNTLITY